MGNAAPTPNGRLPLVSDDGLKSTQLPLVLFRNGGPIAGPTQNGLFGSLRRHGLITGYPDSCAEFGKDFTSRTAESDIEQYRALCRLWVDLDQECPRVPGGIDQSRSGIDDTRGSHRKKNLARNSRAQCGFKDRLRQSFPEPDDSGAQQSSAATTRHRCGISQRRTGITRLTPLTANPMNAAVQLIDHVRSGPLMETIDVLRCHRHTGTSLLQVGDRPVTRMRFCLCDDPSTVLIPFPNGLRPHGEGRRRCQLLGLKALPEPARRSKGRNPAFGRHPRTGEDTDAAGRIQPLDQTLRYRRNRHRRNILRRSGGANTHLQRRTAEGVQEVSESGEPEASIDR